MNPSTEAKWITGTLLAVVIAAGACSGAQQANAANDAKRAAACSVARDAYREARKALFDRGVCDASPEPEQCLPYVVIREAHFAHLERLECPPEKK